MCTRFYMEADTDEITEINAQALRSPEWTHLTDRNCQEVTDDKYMFQPQGDKKDVE